MNMNNNTIQPIGELKFDTISQFFNINEKNKELFKQALLDVAGIYTTLEWPTNKYLTTKLETEIITKRNRQYKTQQYKTQVNLKNNNKIVNYNPNNNANTERIKNNIKLFSKTQKSTENNDNNENNESIQTILNKIEKNPGKEYFKEKLEKNRMKFIIEKPKKYKLNNNNKEFNIGSIVESRTTKKIFQLISAYRRTLLLEGRTEKKIYIYKQIKDNDENPVFYVYSYWGDFESNYYEGILSKILLSICIYIVREIKNNLDKDETKFKNSKIILAGHSDGANLSQHLFINLVRQELVHKNNLFLIALSFPQVLHQSDLEYIYSNLDGHFISLVMMGKLPYKKGKLNNNNNNNNTNKRLTKKQIKNGNTVIDSFTLHHDIKPDSAQVIKSLCILFNKKHKPIDLYNIQDYLDVNNQTTFSFFRLDEPSKTNNDNISNNYNKKLKEYKIFELGKVYHDFGSYVRTGITSLFSTN
jgi:hypothetical protein